MAGLALAGLGLLVVLVMLALPAGTGNPPSQAGIPAESAGYSFATCGKCHSNFDKPKTTATVTVFFSHARHYGRGASACLTCHVPNPHQPDKTIRPEMARCYQCHGTANRSRASGRCLACHPATFIEPASHRIGGWAAGAHDDYAEGNRGYCLTCHATAFCSGCHARRD